MKVRQRREVCDGVGAGQAARAVHKSGLEQGGGWRRLSSCVHIKWSDKGQAERPAKPPQKFLGGAREELVETISVPGATTSGLIRRSSQGPRLLNAAMA